MAGQMQLGKMQLALQPKCSWRYTGSPVGQIIRAAGG